MAIEFHRDGPWEIPEGWVWATLSSVSRFIRRGRGPSYVSTGGVPVINQKCVRWRRLDLQHLKHTARTAFDSLQDDLKLRRGDILWNSTGSGTIGRALVYDGSLPEATADSHITVIRPNEVDPDYVCFFLETMRVQHLVVAGNVGSTNQLELPRAFVQDLMIPIPPLAEQRRIVARIDELFTEIADGETALTRASDDLDTWRSALLKAAVTGELTREWRDLKTPAETGADLVARLRRTHPTIAATRKGWMHDPSIAFALPSSWAWCAVEEAGEVQLGRQRAPQHHSGAHMRPYLRVANVFEGKLNLKDVKWMNFTPAEYEIFSLRSGDILLNEGQTPDLLGRPAIYRNEIEGCCFQKTLLRFRPHSGITPEFALAVFRHYMRNGRFKRESRITTNLAHLTQIRFVIMEFPVPPTDEQFEIVRRIEALEASALEMFDHFECRDIAALRQSILKSAFEGRLVEQDPRDEPAESLLSHLNDRPVPSPPPRRNRARAETQIQ